MRAEAIQERFAGLLRFARNDGNVHESLPLRLDIRHAIRLSLHDAALVQRGNLRLFVPVLRQYLIAVLTKHR